MSSSVAPSEDKENQGNVAPAKTPSKARVSLGTPANFYFKYMNSSKKKASADLSMYDDNTDDDVTGTISIPGLNKSIAEADASMFSLGSSSDEGDLLNKSTLSDTTGFTASSFVLQATSRQAMRQIAAESAKKKASIKQLAASTPVDTAKPVQEQQQEVVIATHNHQQQSAVGQTPTLLPSTTPTKHSTGKRRKSLRGSSPSIRNRMSATPQSLQKLTDDLKNQRVNRQSGLKEDASRRLSMESKLSFLDEQLDFLDGNNDTIDTAALDRKRLPPSSVHPAQKNKDEGDTENVGDTTGEILGVMNEIFGASQDTESSLLPDTSSPSVSDSASPQMDKAEEINEGDASPADFGDTTGEIMDMMSDIFGSSQEGNTNVEETVEEEQIDSPVASPPVKQAPGSLEQEKVVDLPLDSDSNQPTETAQEGYSSPDANVPSTPPGTSTSAGVVPLRRTPGPTPTKLEATPRRIVNPRALDSPARNTRSSAKKSISQGKGLGTPNDTASSSDLRAIIGVNLNLQSPTKDNGEMVSEETTKEETDISAEGNTASMADLMDILGSQPSVSDSTNTEEPEAADGVQQSPSIVEESQSHTSHEISSTQDETPVETNETDRVDETMDDVSSQNEQDVQLVDLPGMPIENPIQDQSSLAPLDTPGESLKSDKGDTASIGDISAILSGRMTQDDDTSHKSVEDGNRDSSATPVDRLEQSQQSFGSSESHLSKKSALGDTASVGDIADILGIASTTMNVESPMSTTSASRSSQGGISTQSVTTPSEASEIENTQESFGSVSRDTSSASKQPETASLADIAEILGSSAPVPSPGSTIQSVEGSPQQFSEETMATNTSHLDKAEGEETVEVPAETGNEMNSPVSLGKRILSGSESTQKEDTDSARSNKRLNQAISPVASPNRHTPTKSPAKSSIRLTPNSHVKPTPTKLNKSPRRVLNPKNIDSPARNTRSAKKSFLGSSMEMEDSSPEGNQSVGSKNILVSDKRQSIVETEIAVLGTKRRRSSVSSVPANIFEKENSILESPAPKKIHRPSILSSMKRARERSAMKPRSVAFGSPEAAEYHVGSPSVNMTPMPSSKAKQLFSIPRGNKSADSANGLNFERDETVEIEAGLDVLVDKINVEQMNDSPSLSPISKVREDTGPVILPGNYDVSASKSAISSSKVNTSSMDESSQESRSPKDMTVELEGAMEGLLATMGETGAKTSDSDMPNKESLSADTEDNARETAMNTSVDLTDTQSIASANSVKSGKFTSTLALGGQKLDFSFGGTATNSGSSSDESMDIEEGDTVELEIGMTGLLAATAVRSAIEAPTQGTSSSLSPIGTVNTTGLESAAPSLNDSKAENLETVELEDGMTGLLRGLETPLKSNKVEDTAALSTIEFDQGHTPSSKRRNSLARRRFTLSPGDKLRFSTDGSIISHEFSMADERSVSFQQPESSQISSPPKNFEALTLDFEEVMKASGFGPDRLVLELGSSNIDTLLRFDATANERGGGVGESWQQFIHAVCGEVEKRTEDGDSAPSSLSNVFDSDPDKFLGLQKQVRGGGDESTRSTLERIVEEGKIVINSEWKLWLATVMESFQSPLQVLSSELSGELSELESLATKYDELQKQLVSMKDKKLQQVRRKSLLRRKTTSSLLEDEIRELQSQLDTRKSAFNSSKATEEDCRNELNDLEHFGTLLRNHEDLRSQAQSDQKTYLSLKGLQSWSPVGFSREQLALHSSGTTALSFKTLVCEISTDNLVSVKVENNVRVPAGMKSSLRHHSGPVSAFLASSIGRVAESTSKNAPSSTDGISTYVQDYVLSMGRLDQTAIEMDSLLRRYNAKLNITPSGSVSFLAKFEGSSSSLSAEFEIDNSYPSLPLELTMDVWKGMIDFESLQKALVKNAKPGFGNLSRACDIISAYVN